MPKESPIDYFEAGQLARVRSCAIGTAETETAEIEFLSGYRSARGLHEAISIRSVIHHILAAVFREL